MPIEAILRVAWTHHTHHYTYSCISCLHVCVCYPLCVCVKSCSLDNFQWNVNFYTANNARVCSATYLYHFFYVLFFLRLIVYCVSRLVRLRRARGRCGRRANALADLANGRMAVILISGQSIRWGLHTLSAMCRRVSRCGFGLLLQLWEHPRRLICLFFGCLGNYLCSFMLVGAWAVFVVDVCSLPGMLGNCSIV